MAEEAGIKENWKSLFTCYFCSLPKMWRQNNTKSKKKKRKIGTAKNIGGSVVKGLCFFLKTVF